MKSVFQINIDIIRCFELPVYYFQVAYDIVPFDVNVECTIVLLVVIFNFVRGKYLKISNFRCEKINIQF